MNNNRNNRNRKKSIINNAGNRSRKTVTHEQMLNPLGNEEYESQKAGKAGKARKAGKAEGSRCPAKTKEGRRCKNSGACAVHK